MHLHPKFNKTVQGVNAAKEVGEEDSKRPLRVNHATREQIVKMLGQPRYEAWDGSAIIYSWRIRKGSIVWPVCAFMTEHVDRQRTLVLHFDANGVLRWFTLKETLPEVGDEVAPKGFRTARDTMTSPRPPQGPTYRTEPSP